MKNIINFTCEYRSAKYFLLNSIKISMQMVGIGTKLDAQTPIAKIHARSQEQADKMAESLKASLTLSDTKPNETKTVSEAVYK